MEEHKKYLEKQIDGILPCLQEEFENAESIISQKTTRYAPLKKQVTHRIFEKKNTDTLSKQEFYQELSKYMIIGFFMSKHFETDSHNLYIDIEMLYQISKDYHILLKGEVVYKFLMNYERMTVFEIIEMCKKLDCLTK